MLAFRTTIVKAPTRPATMNRDNDDKFMSLLSNQRMLLRQIQQETKDSYSSSSALSSPYPHDRPQPSLNCGNFTNSNTIVPRMSRQDNAQFFSQRYYYHHAGAGNSNTNTNESGAFHLMHSQRPHDHLPLHYHQPSHHPSNRLLLPPAPANMSPQIPTVASTNWSQESTQTTISNQDLLFKEYDAMEHNKIPLDFGPSFTDAHNEGYLEESHFDTIKKPQNLQHDDELSRIRPSVEEGLSGMYNDDSQEKSCKPCTIIFEDKKPRDSSTKGKDAEHERGGGGDKQTEKKKMVTKDATLGFKKTQSSCSSKTRKSNGITTIQESPKEKRKSNDPKVQKLVHALEKSAQSQQEIHSWDRKMGLKRSHSKTMTQSMQSRKKLRRILDNIFQDW